MYRQREIDQTRRGIVDSSNNPNVGTDIVRANCWTDTLRDILESYATQTTTSTMRMRRQAIQAMLVSGYFENLAQTLFDVIKRKSVLLVSSRQLSDITMLAELFEDIEGHFLERYRLTADKWNQPRHRELRAHMAEIRGIVTTFSLERRVSSDVEGLCSQGNPIAVLESDMARRAFIAAIWKSWNVDVRRVSAIVRALASAMEYGSDIGDIAGMLTDATSKDLERLRGSFDTFEKHISDGLRDMGYDEEVIASFLAEAEVATEVLCELAIRPDEAGVEEMPPVAPRPARSPAGYPTAASTTTIRILRTPAPLVDMPSPSRDIVEPAPRTRAGIGIRMTAGHVKERWQKYWNRLAICLRHDHQQLFAAWLRNWVAGTDTVHPQTRRGLTHTAMEHGAAKILAMLAQHGMADWSTRDVEGSGPLRRLLFQKPLQKDFFLEMLSFVGPDEIFDHELRLLAAEIEDIIGMVRSEERRAELDFILDHIGLRFAPPEPYIPVSIAAAALAPVVSGREEASSGNGNIDAIWRELAVFGPDQRERLVAAGLPRHLLNDLIRGMATLGLVEAVMWTSVYEIDAEDTDPATLAAGKEAGKDLIRDLLSGAED